MSQQLQVSDKGMIPIEAIPLLGKVSDRELAKQYGLSAYYFKQARLAKGIEAFSHGQSLPAEVVSRLGTVADATLASIYSIPAIVLFRARESRGIARYRKNPAPSFEENAGVGVTDLLPFLGKESDSKVASRFGVPPGFVRMARQARGIKCYRKASNRSHLTDNEPAIRVPWTAEALSLIGKIRDSEISRKFGISRTAVRNKRESLGIPVLPKGRWTPEWMALLGTISDHELAARTKGVLSVGDVRQTRYDRRIALRPEFKVDRSIIKWTPDIIALLGKVSDKKVAQKLNCSTSTVNLKRNSLGIPCLPKSIPWTAEALATLGKVSDADIAQMLNCANSTVGEKRASLGIAVATKGGWTHEWMELIGKIPDRELADRSTGVLTVENVRRVRIARKIAVCPAPKPARKGQATREDVISLLGSVSDYEIARRTGVERSEITRQRLLLGIPSAMRSGRPARKWTPEEDCLLGVISDRQVASLLKISNKAVSRRRRELLIEVAPASNASEANTDLNPGIPTIEVRSWTPEAEALLGTKADSQLAHELKRSFWDVYNRRKQLGIAAYEYAYS